ncbi:MAG TPA: PTS sugar transporter subunit IIA [Spirochaetia bacterium]|nr:PTS sugar transporter subunit IIA [Spirochaetia bacterium]
MAISDYLSCDRIIFLKGRTKLEAFEELAERLASDVSIPAVPPVTVLLEEIWKRESFLSTRVSRNVALPHAIIGSMEHTFVAVGISRSGIPYEDTKDDLPVQVIVMLIGSETEHLSALSDVAAKLSSEPFCRELLLCRTPEDACTLLAASAFEAHATADAPTASAFTVAHGISLAEEISASRIILYADAIDDPGTLADLVTHHGMIIVTSDRARIERLEVPPDSIVAVPFRGANRSSQIEVSLLFLLSQGIISRGERILSIYGIPHSGLLDSIVFTDVDKEFRLYFAFDSEERPDDLDQQVLTRVLQIANELAFEGREGKPVGTLFVVGDYANVAHYCQQLIVNPFQGIRDPERNILDPSLEDTIKEFSRIDGAFIIRGDGVIVSAGTYIKADTGGAHFAAGLGARHASAAMITAMTRSIAIAISESTQRISLFRSGERFLQF